MASSSRTRRTRWFLVGAVVAGVLGMTAVGQAAAPTVNGTALFDGITAYTDQARQLAGQGVLGEVAAFTSLDPSGPQGLDLHHVFDEVIGGLPASFKELDPATAPAAVAAELEKLDLDASSPADLKVSVGCPKTGSCSGYAPVAASVTGDIVILDVPLKVERTVSVPVDVPLPLPSGSPVQVEGASLNVPLAFTGTLPFRLDTAQAPTDPAKAFYVAGTPELTATLGTTTDATGVSVAANLGFTDVTAALKNLNVSTTLTAALRDPDEDGKVTVDEFGGMALTDMFALSRSGSASGRLELDTSLTAANPDFTKDFTDAGDGPLSLDDGFTFPTINPAALLDFRNITPEQVISGFGQAAAAIAGSQKVGDLELPFLQGALSDAISVAQPMFDFVNQQAVVCGTSKQTPPTGLIPQVVAKDTKIYCQAFVVHDPTQFKVAAVDWQVPSGIDATFDAPSTQADKNKTVSLTPTEHAEFTMTAAGTFDARATYDLVKPSDDTLLQSGLVTQRPAATAQKLLTKIQQLGGFMDQSQLEAVDPSGKVLDYDTTTKALKFRLRKEFNPPRGELGYDFGDQLEAESGIIALQANPNTKVKVDVTGAGLDVTVGVLLGDLSDIGQGQPCADPTKKTGAVRATTNTDDCPANEFDRFFVQVNDTAGNPEFFVRNGSVSMDPAPTLRGRLGFVGVEATPTAFTLGKRAGDSSPVLAVDITTPSGGLAVGGSTISDAVRLRELLFSIGDFVGTPAVNLKFDGALTVKALIGTTEPQTELGAGTVTVSWPDVTSGLPAVSVSSSFTDTLKDFNIDPNVFGTHTGASSPAVAPDPDNPSPTPASAVLTDPSAAFTDEVIGKRVDNLTDGSFCTVTARTATTLTCATGLGGGDVNQWRADDQYRVHVGDPLAMLWKVLENMDTIVAGIDGLGGGVGDVYEKNLPFVGVSPKELVRQVNDLKRAASEMRGGPQPTIACGLQIDAGSKEPVEDPSQLEITGSQTKNIFCQVDNAKEATAVSWSIVKGGGASPAVTNANDVGTVVTPTTASADKKSARATIVGSDSDGGRLRSAEHPNGYAIRATFTDADGEHVVDFPEQSVPATLQDFEAMLESKLKLPPSSFSITPVGAGSARRVKLDLSYGICGYEGATAPAVCAAGAKKTPSFSAPLNVNLGSTGGLVGVGATGEVDVQYAADARLAMSFAVSPALDPKVEPETAINVKGRFLASNINLGANLGPFAIQAGTGGKPGGGGAGQLRVAADFALRNPSTSAVAVDSYASGLTASFSAPSGAGEDCGTIDLNDPPTDATDDDTPVTGVACGRLSLALKSGDSIEHLSDVGFSVPSLPASGSFTVTPHVPPALANRLASEVLSWDTLLHALPELLARLEDGLRASSGSGPDGAKVPIVGDALDAGADVVGVVNDEVIPLATQIGDAVDEALADCSKVACENDPPGCDPAVDDPCEEAVTPNANPTDVEQFIGDFLWDQLGHDDGGADLIRKNFSTVANGERNDIKVTAYCDTSPLTACTATDDLLDIEDVRLTFNLGQAAGTDVENAPVFDPGFDGLPLRVAGALEASAGWNLLVDLGVSASDGPYLVVADENTPGYAAGNRPEELRLDANVRMGQEPSAGSICNSEVNDPASGDATATAISTFAASPNRCFAGKLGFVGVNMRDESTDAKRTGIALGTFLDLRSKNAPSATALTKIKLTDLVSGQLEPVAKLDVDSKINLRFRTGIGQLQDAGFPTVVGTFELRWRFVKQFGGAVDESGSGVPLSIKFDNLHLDASSFFREYLKPTLDEVRNITGPFKPVIDTLNAPLPVVSDLAALVGEPPITLLGLMELVSDNNLTVIKSLASFVSFAVDVSADSNFASGLIPLGAGSGGGAFPLKAGSAQSRRNLQSNPGPANADSLIDKASGAYRAGTDLLRKPVAPGTGSNAAAVARASNTGLGLTRDNLPGTFGVPGLTFPFMSDASQIFGFVMGNDITLIRYDVGTLRATAGFSYNFGPFMVGPVPVTAGIGGSATLEGRFALGYDTSGLRKVLSGGSGTYLFDGIFIDDLDSNLVDVPEIKLIGDIYARAGVTVFIATAGIEGGITMTVALNLDDRPNPDGKLRIEEVFNKMSNPICLFDVSGKLEAYLKAFLEINYFLDTKKWDWELVRVTLLEFSGACSPPKPQLASQSGSTLTLNMGSPALRNARKVATTNINEKFVVRPAGNGRYSVEAFGVYQVYGPNAPFSGAAITRVVANAGDGDDVVLLEPGNDETNGAANTIDFTAVAELNGEDGNDTLKAGTADDELVGGSGNDKLEAGAGNDYVEGGDNDDQLTGDVGSDVLVGGNHTDRLSGGPGADYLDGGDGDDIVTGGPGAPPETTDESLKDLADVLIGGTGADSVEGANGDDIVYGEGVSDGTTDLRMFGKAAGPGKAVNAQLGNFMTAGGFVPAGLLPASAPASVATVCAHAYGTGGDDVLDGGDADDTLFGGAANDRIAAGKGDDTLCGNNGHDELDGDDPSLEGSGGGRDDLNGGSGDDVLRGRSGRDIISGDGNSDVLFGGAGADHLLGGSGDDDLMGAVGNDVLDGGAGTNILVGDSATIAGADKPATERRAMPASQAARIALVSNIGTAGDNTLAPSCTYNRSASGTTIDLGFADCVTGGSGDDVMFGEGGKDRMQGGAASDHMRGGDHDDEMDGDAGTDDMYGDLHADTMRGGGANDTMRGNEGADYMEGNAATDTMRGDADDDRMIGGSNVSAADANDVIDGDGGLDVVAGDNATITAGNVVTLLDVAGGDATLFGGDTVSGGPHHDLVFGQGGVDTLNGDAGRDRVIGNGAGDTINGGLDDDLLIGGSSPHATLRSGGVASSTVSFGDAPDGIDTINGNAGDDLVFGDNVDADFDALEPGNPVFATTHPAGTFGDDILTGNAGQDVLWGQLGGDTINGTADGDYLIGDLATVDGDADGNPLRTWPGGAPEYKVALVQPLTGGTDTMNGGDDDDHLFGGAAADTVAGGLHDDYLEGNVGQDELYGLSATFDNGSSGDPNDADEAAAIVLGTSDQDDIIGGSSTMSWADASTTAGSDTGETEMFGNADHDVMAGDNADIERVVDGDDPTQWADDLVLSGARRRNVSLRDRDKTTSTTPRLDQVSGADDMFGNGGFDRMYGEGGDDRMKGNDSDDYLEGNQGSDWLEGNDGEDDLIGGSSFELGALSQTGDPDAADFLHGGGSSDVITGDNAVISRSEEGAAAPVYLNTDGRFLGFTTPRWLRLLDLEAPVATRYGDDFVSGGEGEDIALGQDGSDAISGGPDDDYLEGNGAIDRIFGDRLPWNASVAARFPAVPAGIGGADGSGFRSSALQLDGPTAADGQDDILGGSALAGHRDGQGDTDVTLPDPSKTFAVSDFEARFGDYVFGDGDDDFVLGDNGTLTRFSAGHTPVSGSYLRSVGRDGTAHRLVREAVRFDVGGMAGPWGDDFVEGGDGDDAVWAQNGNDEVWGNAGDDDLLGELGDDRVYGGAGEDALLGDRGSIRNTAVTDGMRAGGQPFEAFTVDTNGPPFLVYTAFTTHRYDRRVNLYQDVEGAVGALRPGGDRAIAASAMTDGGADVLRGGPDHDSVHGAGGDDILNGDSGGDYLFGGHGADVVWGGRGSTLESEADLREPADATEDFDDRWVDYIFGGKGGDRASPTNGIVTGGADVLDFRPRTAYEAGTKREPVTLSDPEVWHENVSAYTSRHDDVQESLRQHHHGVDWIYGGFDRDVMQANVAGQGPNDRDRLMDWAGTYNLYTHCEPDYGGYNDIYAISPIMIDAMERIAYATGAGESVADVLRNGSSGFDELALVYHHDVRSNTGQAYPTTPGHFTQTACGPEPTP